MLDVSLSHTVIAVVIIIVTMFCMRRGLSAGQRELLAEVRQLIRIKRMEMELRGSAARGSAETLDDPEERIAAIIAEIESGPYVRHHVRPDLPPDVGRLQLDTTDGPVTVTGPARRPRAAARRRAGRGYHGLAAVPALAASLWRGLLTTTQAGAVAAVTMAPAVPMPPVRASEPPPALVQSVHSSPDTYPQRPSPPAATPPTAPPSEDHEQDEEEMPAAELTPTPGTSPTPSPPKTADPTPTASASPERTPVPSPTSASPLPSQPTPPATPTTPTTPENGVTAEATTPPA